MKWRWLFTGVVALDLLIILVDRVNGRWNWAYLFSIVVFFALASQAWWEWHRQQASRQDK